MTLNGEKNQFIHVIPPISVSKFLYGVHLYLDVLNKKNCPQ